MIVLVFVCVLYCAWVQSFIVVIVLAKVCDILCFGTVILSSDCTGLCLFVILCLGTVILSSDCTGLGMCDILLGCSHS